MRLSTAALDRWVWVLIYGGLLALCLGLFVGRQDAGFGLLIVALGAAAAAAGVLLLWRRSRIKDGA